MTHQFKPGDRALKIPRIIGRPWEEVVIASVPYVTGRVCLYTSKILPPELSCDIEPQEQWGKGSFACPVRQLIPLPKNGPDAEVDMARKLVELHGGRHG